MAIIHVLLWRHITDRTHCQNVYKNVYKKSLGENCWNILYIKFICVGCFSTHVLVAMHNGLKRCNYWVVSSTLNLNTAQPWIFLKSCSKVQVRIKSCIRCKYKLHDPREVIKSRALAKRNFHVMKWTNIHYPLGDRDRVDIYYLTHDIWICQIHLIMTHNRCESIEATSVHKIWMLIKKTRHNKKKENMRRFIWSCIILCSTHLQNFSCNVFSPISTTEVTQDVNNPMIDYWTI